MSASEVDNVASAINEKVSLKDGKKKEKKPKADKSKQGMKRFIKRFIALQLSSRF